MATTQPPLNRPPTEEQKAANIALLKRNVAIALAITCPILIALPPRILDFYTVGLASGAFLSLNHLQKHNTGRSFFNYIGINDETPATVSDAGSASTETARRYQRLLKEKKEAEAAGRPWVPKRLDEVEPVPEGKSVLEQVWLGDQKEDWKAKRDRKEREAFERGDGIGSLIQDYFAEAVGFKKDEEAEEKNAKDGKA